MTIQTEFWVFLTTHLFHVDKVASLDTSKFFCVCIFSVLAVDVAKVNDQLLDMQGIFFDIHELGREIIRTVCYWEKTQ